nr:low-density lipoprotein receptor-related protein 4 isoform X1 [Ciona intestinalis]|eukprot:XP_018667004.1 low-density lipoprotein receptor-related protein 4 isoform X1 [Ciona intestinalis]
MNNSYTPKAWIIFCLAIITIVCVTSMPECKCKRKQFACSVSNKCTCIPVAWKCDGDTDCGDASDEMDCVIPTCRPSSFQCDNGKCIMAEWKCDGENDCGDDSDEVSCPIQPCDESTEKTCGSGDCVPKRWWCDGDEDCSDGSDETDCNRRTCGGTEYACTSGECVSSAFNCDGDFDCRDGSDEECAEEPADPDVIPSNSNFTACKDEEFSCAGSDSEVGHGQLDFCIPFEYVCDQELDCDNGIDERNCSHPCTDEQYRCGNGQCIGLHNHCDGQDDCGDGTDEINCPEYEECIYGEFKCKSGMCISEAWRCDGDSDCNDGSDEQNCHEEPLGCNDDQFECFTSKRCIRISWRCDGEHDCSDQSDEIECDTCGSGKHRCNNGQCIGMHKVCDGVVDCLDSSDESPRRACNGSNMLPTNFTSCADNNGGCEHTCRESLSGRAQCICRKGFELSPDLSSCIDLNECNEEASCSQVCNNTIGSFVCSCLHGYILRPDSRTCKASGPEPALLFTNRIDIRKILPDRSEFRSILRDLENAIGLDYHIDKGLMFWTDVTLDRIMRSYVNGSDVQEVVSSGLESPGGVAVDWIHNLLYWTDSGTSRLEVSLLDGSLRKVLVWERLEKPRALALHPLHSLMFWTDWGDTPRLESAAMDGSQRHTVASRNLHWPNGLAIDYTRNHIYWADAKYHIIEKANLDGGDRRAVISRGLLHPFGVTIFEDKLYWTDWQTKSVNSANKFTGRGVKTIRSRLHFPMDIQTYHPLRQPNGHNRCEQAHCSHLCLPRPDGITCACPTGFRRVNITHCAEDINHFLVFTRKTDIRRISFDGVERADTVLPVKNLKNAVALDWHSDHPGHIYWSDVSKDTISRAEWDGSQEKVIVSSSLDSPAGLAIDWITNKIYWTEAGINRIEVALLDGSMRCVLIWTGLDRPRAIVVHPKTGHMIWSDWGAEPKIERAGMDGTNRTTLVSTGLTWPNGVAIDYTSDMIYWTDAGAKTIETCDLHGAQRRVLVNDDLPHPFGITLDATRIYWTDWQSKCISSADKVTGGDRTVLRENLEYLMDIRFYHKSRPMTPNPCSVRNGGCTHLCLLSPNIGEGSHNILSTPYRCACPTGLTLSPDRHKCNTEMNKFLAIARRTDIRVISLDVQYSADVKLPIKSYLANVVDVAVEPRDGYLYWSDIGSHEISRSHLIDPTVSEVVISSGLDIVEGLAIDAVGRLLYWTDDGRDIISVSTLDGKHKRILINDDLGSPRAITLHYGIGYMYWTDWGNKPSAKIERAGMDGSDRSVIIDTGLTWPNGITIDTELGWLIWGDAQTEKIERSDLLGRNRTILYSSSPHPYSISCLDGLVYWTDWETRDVRRLDLHNTSDVQTLRGNMPSMMGMKAVSMEPPAANMCGLNNGGCSHLCIRSPTSTTGFICACPTGVRIKEDKQTCDDLPTEYLLFTTRLSIRRVSLEADKNSYVELPAGELENTIALDYHYGRQLLFFTDVYLDVIKRSNLDGSDTKVIVSRNLKTTDGVAVDWVADNIYWTDAGPNTISVARLDGTSRKVVIDQGLDEPRALVVHPSRGIIFWTDWGDKAKIEKANMDGSARKTLVRKNLQWPNGLTIDYNNSRLYYVDAYDELNRIETCDFNGRKRKVVVSPVPHGFAITYLSGTLYWTDWQTSSIHSITYPFNSSKRKTILGGVEGLMDIKAVSSKRQTGTSLCDTMNGYGGCSHLCLMKGSRTLTCACPDPIDPPQAPVADSILPNINHESPDGGVLNNCSLTPVRIIKHSSTHAPALVTAYDLTTLSSEGTLHNNISVDTKAEAQPIVIHVLAVFLAAALIVFVIIVVFGFFMWKKIKKRKTPRSNIPSNDNATVTYRNNVSYRSGSNSLLHHNNTSSEHTPTLWPGVDPRNKHERSSLINRSENETHPADDSLPTSEDDRYDETSTQYSRVSTLEGPKTKLPSRKLGTVGLPTSRDHQLTAPQALPLLRVTNSPQTCQATNQLAYCIDDGDVSSCYSDDDFSNCGDVPSPIPSKAKSKNRLLRNLLDKQPKMSVTTTCTMLSEDDCQSSEAISANSGTND